MHNARTKVVGASERMLSDLFSAARRAAPCFLLLDNLDILLGADADTDTNIGTGSDMDPDQDESDTEQIPGIDSNPEQPLLDASVSVNNSEAQIFREKDSVPDFIDSTDHISGLSEDRPHAGGKEDEIKVDHVYNKRTKVANMSSEPSNRSRQFRTSRTKHKALDRILSTLLIEVTGILLVVMIIQRLLILFSSTENVIYELQMQIQKMHSGLILLILVN